MASLRSNAGGDGRERLANLCQGALDELVSERASAEPDQHLYYDNQIETIREMLHWARSKH